MQAQLPIGGQQRRAEERRQFAGGGAAEQIHLKIAVLTVNVSERPREIVAILRRDGRHAGGIALDRHRPGETGKRGSSVDGRAGWRAG